MSGPADATPFSVHASAYWAARAAYEAHRGESHPEHDCPLQLAYEAAYQPLVDAMHDAAVAAVKTPAATVAEIIDKVAIFDRENLFYDCDLERVRDLFDFITDDITAHSPGAYRKGGAA